jgi:hypothetical protein
MRVISARSSALWFRMAIANASRHALAMGSHQVEGAEIGGTLELALKGRPVGRTTVYGCRPVQA